MRIGGLLRTLLRLLAVTALLGLTAPSVGADSRDSTVTLHGVTETIADVNPCTGDPATITLTYNAVFHESLDASGGMHVTGTLTGTFELVPDDASLPSYTGRFTIWFGGNIGANGAGFWQTFSVTGYGSDGSVIHFNAVAQFHASNGVVHVEFTMGNCRV